MNYQNLTVPAVLQASHATARCKSAAPPNSFQTKEHLRELFAVYADLARCLNLSPPPYADFSDKSDRQIAPATQNWVEQLDQQLEVHQLRLFFQTTASTTQGNLRTLIWHHLARAARTASDRDKLDFLLVQYVHCCAPAYAAGLAVTTKDIADTLRPVIGTVTKISDFFLNPVETILHEVERCRSLTEIINQDCLEEGRRLKASVGDRFWEPQALVAFTWLNFILRRACFHLLYAEMESLRENLRLLDQRGIHQVDCRRAELSEAEPVGTLHQLCDRWMQSLRAPYCAGKPLTHFAAICSSVADALLSRAAAQRASSTAPLALEDPSGRTETLSPLIPANGDGELARESIDDAVSTVAGIAALTSDLMIGEEAAPDLQMDTPLVSNESLLPGDIFPGCADGSDPDAMLFPSDAEIAAVTSGPGIGRSADDIQTEMHLVASPEYTNGAVSRDCDPAAGAPVDVAKPASLLPDTEGCRPVRSDVQTQTRLIPYESISSSNILAGDADAAVSQEPLAGGVYLPNVSQVRDMQAPEAADIRTKEPVPVDEHLSTLRTLQGPGFVAPAVLAVLTDPDLFPHSSPPSAPASDVRFDQRAALQSCLDSIRAQLNTAGSRRQDAMGTVLYNGSRLLLHSWECESFRRPESSGSTALQSAVAARAVLAEAQERFLHSANRARFEAVIELAEQQVEQLKESAERARHDESMETAANLSGSAKRLHMSIAKARNILSGSSER